MRKVYSRLFAILLTVPGLVDLCYGQLPVKKFLTPDGKRPDAMFAPGVMVGKTLYISGLSGFSPVEGLTTVDLEKQVRQMAQNHMDILETAGLKLEDVVSGCVYLRNINDYAAMNAIYSEYFSLSPGVRTCLMPNSGYEKTTCASGRRLLQHGR